MRIAVITSSYPATTEDPSGHFVHTETRMLIEAGHEVTVVLPRAPKPRPTSQARLCELPHFGLFGWPGTLARLRQCPWRIAGLGPYTLAARRRLEELGPFERIVAHWIIPGFWPICRDFEAETVVVAHGSDVGLIERLPRWAGQGIVETLARPNLTLRCVSLDLARRVLRLASDRTRGKLTVVVEPTAIEVPLLPARSELRRQLGLTACPIVVIVGRVVKDKSIDRAIMAATTAIEAARLSDRASVVVIGDGPERSALMRRFPETRWLGTLGHDETMRYIRAADLLVSASLSEGAPTAIREARALGTAVIAAQAGDLMDWAASDPGLSVVESFSTERRGRTCTLIRDLLLRADLSR
jgi:teichuronic acid biosynthesis glycosyltransferase TuaC